uniref:Uncharacterized protein n=1 Tax=Triticum urartu TaxID=4572 RepID=A0A8R7QIX4_TRIUA
MGYIRIFFCVAYVMRDCRGFGRARVGSLFSSAVEYVSQFKSVSAHQKHIRLQGYLLGCD